MAFHKALPLSEKERAYAILTWASPVFSVVAKVVHPMVEIRQKVHSWAWEGMGVRSWVMTSPILMQEESKGGIGLCMPSLYISHLHSKRYVQFVANPDQIPHPQQDGVQLWPGPGVDASIAKEAFNWDHAPIQAGLGHLRLCMPQHWVL